MQQKWFIHETTVGDGNLMKILDETNHKTAACGDPKKLQRSPQRKTAVKCHGDVGSENPHFDIDSIPTINILFSHTML